MLTRKQRQEHLAKANAIRMERAQIRAEVNELPRTDGIARVVELLQAPPASLLTMTVREIMFWPYRWGPMLTDRMILPNAARRLNTTPESLGQRRLEKLTARQVRELVRALQERIAYEREHGIGESEQR